MDCNVILNDFTTGHLTSHTTLNLPSYTWFITGYVRVKYFFSSVNYPSIQQTPSASTLLVLLSLIEQFNMSYHYVPRDVYIGYMPQLGVIRRHNTQIQAQNKSQNSSY